MVRFRQITLIMLSFSIGTEASLSRHHVETNLNLGGNTQLKSSIGRWNDGDSLHQTRSRSSQGTQLAHVYGRKRSFPVNIGSRPQSPIRAISGAFMERSPVPIAAESKIFARISPHHQSHASIPSIWRKEDLTKCDATGCWSIDTTDDETKRTLHALKFAVAL